MHRPVTSFQALTAKSRTGISCPTDIPRMSSGCPRRTLTGPPTHRSRGVKNGTKIPSRKNKAISSRRYVRNDMRFVLGCRNPAPQNPGIQIYSFESETRKIFTGYFPDSRQQNCNKNQPEHPPDVRTQNRPQEDSEKTNHSMDNNHDCYHKTKIIHHKKKV